MAAIKILSIPRVLSLGLSAAIAFTLTTSTIATVEFELHVPVLMYHRIIKAPAGTGMPQLWVSPTRFERQLRALRRRGWRTITSAQLARSLRRCEPAGKKRFVITIDDGARDGYKNALPVLQRLGMRVTFCVTPGRASKSWQLSFELMRRLHRAGNEIANQTLTRADLSSLPESRLRRQIRDAQRLIESRVGTRPVTMCYPYGRQNQRVRKQAARAGIILGFTTVDGARQAPSNRLRSPRIRINGSDSAADVVRKLRPYEGFGQRFRPADQRQQESPDAMGQQRPGAPDAAPGVSTSPLESAYSVGAGANLAKPTGASPVSSDCSDPSERISQSETPPCRVEWNASTLPSLDQVGNSSSAGCVVSNACWLPSAFMTPMSKLPAWLVVNAMRVPSGDQRGS